MITRTATMWTCSPAHGQTTPKTPPTASDAAVGTKMYMADMRPKVMMPRALPSTRPTIEYSPPATGYSEPTSA